MVDAPSRAYHLIMEVFPRITIEPDKCAGKACIRGYRLTVEHVLGLLAEGLSRDDMLKEWDFLVPEDIDAALRYAAWLAGDRTVSMAS